MFEFLQVFTSYYNRLYTSESGVKSQRWLYDQITEVRRLFFDTAQVPDSLL